MKLSNNAPTLTALLEECLAEIEAMYYNQLSLGQHIFWYFSHQAHLGDSFVSFLPFILYLGSNLEEKLERERERRGLKCEKWRKNDYGDKCWSAMLNKNMLCFFFRYQIPRHSCWFKVSYFCLVLWKWKKCESHIYMNLDIYFIRDFDISH